MRKLLALLLLLIVGFLIFWFFYPLQSYIVMGIYSGQHSASSVMRENGFTIDMPLGEGWYPFVLTYNATGFRGWSGIDADMSIMYNFGAFDPVTRTSSIYDTESDKYSSFYGAYAVKKKDGAFGFSDGKLDMDEVAKAVNYDYTQLVLAAFGCREPVFSVGSVQTQEDASIAGSGGWTRIDAALSASGCAHNFKSDKTPYLQYGRPMKEVPEDFATVNMHGRIYAKYLEQYGCTVMLYVITPSESAAGVCDSGILQKTVIKAS